jgi:hypothetical protein
VLFSLRRFLAFLVELNVAAVDRLFLNQHDTVHLQVNSVLRTWLAEIDEAPLDREAYRTR